MQRIGFDAKALAEEIIKKEFWCILRGACCIVLSGIILWVL